MTEAMHLAKLLSQSTIIPKEYRGSPGNVLVAIQWGMELGLGPVQALQGIAVINGRPSIWGDAMLALVLGSGLLEDMQEEQADDWASCTLKRKGMEPTTRTFTRKDAETAGLWGKKSYDGKPTPWVTYPKRMMQMRARAYALRDVFADVLRGIHIAEESQDISVDVTATLIPEYEQQTSEPASQPLQIAAPATAETEVVVVDAEQPPFASTPPKPPALASAEQKSQIGAVCASLNIDGVALADWLKETYGTTWGKLTSIDAAAVYYDISGIMTPFQRAGGINGDQMSLIKSLGSDLGLTLLGIDLDCRGIYEGLGLASLSRLQAEDYTDRLSVRVGDLVEVA